MIHQLDKGPSVSERLTQSMNQGFGSALDQLAQHKIEEMLYAKQAARQEQQFNNAAKQWESIGLPAPLSNLLARSGEGLQKSFLDRLEGLNLGGEQQQLPQMSRQQNSMNGYKVARSQLQPQNAMDALGQVDQQSQNPLDMLLGNNSQIQPSGTGIMSEKQPSFIRQSQKSGLRLGKTSQQRAQEEALNVKKEALAQRESQFATSESRKIQEGIDKSNAPYYNELTNKIASALDTNNSLEIMRELNNKGDLGSNFKNFLLNSAEHLLGEKFNTFRSDDAQLFQKISNGLIRNAKDIFGARITNLDLQTFLKTIPTLNNTPEARDKLISAMQLLNKFHEVQYDEANKLIDDNNGKYPERLKAKVVYNTKDEIAQLTHNWINENIKSGQPGQKIEQLSNNDNISIGVKARDDETGEIYIKTAAGWKKE